MSKRFIDSGRTLRRRVTSRAHPAGAWPIGTTLDRYLLLSLVLLMAFLLAGCSNAPVKQAAIKPAPASADVETGYRQALDHLQASQWQAAADRLATITAQNDTLAGPWLNLGIARSRLGEPVRAEAALQQSIARNPGQPVAYNQLGILYREAGRYREARKQYELALAVQPDYPDAHWNLGILHDLYLQQPQQALEHYTHYQQLTGSDDRKLQLWIKQLQEITASPTLAAGASNP